MSISQVLTFTDEWIVGLGLSPGLLDESRTASFALRSARVVLAATEQLVRVVRVGDVARLGVTVAHAPAADGNVTDRVKELQADYWLNSFGERT